MEAPPTNPNGILFDLSNRNILCSFTDYDRIILGSSDHKLYSIDKQSSSHRCLKHFNNGHKDWVTCVAGVGSGGIVSGCAGGKICAWKKDAKGTNYQLKAEEMAHFKGGTTALKNINFDIVASCGYDGRIIVWSTEAKLHAAATLESKDSEVPILDFDYCESNCLIASAKRNGFVSFWDLETRKIVANRKKHCGHATTVKSFEYMNKCCVLSGGQDGYVSLFDTRSSSNNLMRFPAHRSENGAGALCGIITVNENTFFSYGADSIITVTDVRKGIEHRFLSHQNNFIYNVIFSNNILISGGGNGVVLFHNLLEKSLLYGLGCNEGAVRCLGISGTTLVTAGDDGKAILYEF